MIYEIQNGKLVETDSLNCDNSSIVISKYIKGEVPHDDDKVKQNFLDEIFMRSYSRYESYENMDMICMNLIYIEKYEDESNPVYILIENKKITFYTTTPDYIESLIKKIMHEPIVSVTIGDVLYYFMHKLIYGDLIHLENIESQLTALETNAFSGKTDSNFSKQILKIKKHLMWIGLYYEQFINLVCDLSQNLNGLLSKNTLKKFSMLDSKLDRLSGKTTNLMNYASEIRSAYQAEVDLQLNKAMKVLTIITVIVLPLTLIAGWYGMNLQMPEYAYGYSYPVVIVLSAIVIIGSFIFFKKNKWF